jgi:DNA-binding CsgD family transcriptional regulator
MNESKPLTQVLTRREKEILNYIAQGLCSKQIADRLTLSVNTVANHRKNMLYKTQTKSSAELIYLYSKYA